MRSELALIAVSPYVQKPFLSLGACAHRKQCLLVSLFDFVQGVEQSVTTDKSYAFSWGEIAV